MMFSALRPLWWLYDFIEDFIGRIFLSPAAPEHRPWEWESTTRNAPPSRRARKRWLRSPRVGVGK
jgi:hypothetical protein